MIKSPLRYPGGKSRAVENIARYVPSFEEYREPFAGGASMLLYLKQLFPHKNYWLNDIYEELYFFWKTCQDNVHKVMDNIRNIRDSYDSGKSLHRYLRENMNDFSLFEKACAFFIMNRITFSGTTLSGGFSNSAYQHRFTESSIKRLAFLETVLENVTITNVDYTDIVLQNGKNVFIFLDPPYYSAKQSALYGKNGSLHTFFDHERFANTIKASPHQWLITYDDSPYIRELFSFAHILPWNLKYGMRNTGRKHPDGQNGKELFISNYPLTIPTQTQNIQQTLFNVSV